MSLSPHHHLGLVARSGALAFVLGASGCTSDADDAFVGGAEAFEASEAGAGTCAPCVASHCTAAWALCLTDESCLGVVSRCATSAHCEGACTAEADGGRAGGALYRAFTSCTDARTCAEGCWTDCAASCVAGGPSTTPAACGADLAPTTNDASVDPDAGDSAAPQPATADSCAGCADGKCGDPKKACAIGSECASFLACVFGCTDSACTDECGRLHATGKVAAVELATCTKAGCETECGLGTLE